MEPRGRAEAREGLVQGTRGAGRPGPPSDPGRALGEPLPAASRCGIRGQVSGQGRGHPASGPEPRRKAEAAQGPPQGTRSPAPPLGDKGPQPRRCGGAWSGWEGVGSRTPGEDPGPPREHRVRAAHRWVQVGPGRRVPAPVVSTGRAPLEPRTGRGVRSADPIPGPRAAQPPPAGPRSPGAGRRPRAGASPSRSRPAPPPGTRPPADHCADSEASGPLTLPGGVSAAVPAVPAGGRPGVLIRAQPEGPLIPRSRPGWRQRPQESAGGLGPPHPGGGRGGVGAPGCPGSPWTPKALALGPVLQKVVVASSGGGRGLGPRREDRP